MLTNFSALSQGTTEDGIIYKMGKWRLSEKEFKEIYSQVPRLCVEVIVKGPQGGVVLSLRDISPCKGLWHIPGGTVYYRETLDEAVKRVAQKELGVEVKVEKLLGYIHYPSVLKETGWDCPVGIAFLTKIKSGRLRGSNQGRDVRIFKTIPKNMVVEQKRFLKEVLGLRLH